MEEETKNKNSSSFWLGLLVGAVAAGLLVLFLEKDNGEKENLIRNLKNDWGRVLEKINELVNDKKELKSEALEIESVLEQTTEPKDVTIVKVAKEPVKKFFKKAGKKLG